ncbi:Rrf2 family transcriptional regulator [Clostridium sp. D33t1_170424_F3]|uniref:RrF2 family transcriptional regulator n=1 Tax=Clostridium sp. D33t1_170424_F3 TaxID=2787099 RepID=UPI0018ABDEFE|nr:Rrf2 family transcriptional regulator [Clostridium sp. D33t1_170424_F3]
MLITREMDYALRILRTLSNGEPADAEKIYQKEIIPAPFGETVLKKLEKGGLIQISNDTPEYCRLNVDLKTVTLYDLMTAVGAETQINACMKPGHLCEWRITHRTECAVHNRLVHIQKALDDELRAHTLYQMLLGDG